MQRTPIQIAIAQEQRVHERLTFQYNGAKRFEEKVYIRGKITTCESTIKRLKKLDKN